MPAAGMIGKVEFISKDQALAKERKRNVNAALELVGLPIAVADAYPEILDHVRFQTALPGGLYQRLEKGERA